MSELVRLRGTRGQDEVNAQGVSYRVRWGFATVPKEDVEPLLRVGGFHLAAEDDESAEHSTLADVEAAVWSLPLGKTRSTLLALVTNTNALNFLAEKARPSISII